MGWFLLMRNVWCFCLLSQCCACNFLSTGNHKTKDSWHIYFKSTMVRERMHKLASVLALSICFSLCWIIHSKSGETNTRISVEDRKANPCKKAVVLINMHWPRNAYYVVNTTIWHSWLSRENLEMSDYPLHFVPMSNLGAHKEDFIPRRQEGASNHHVGSLIYNGNTYL